MLKFKGKFRQKVCAILIVYFGYVYCDLDSPCPRIWTYSMVNNDLKGLIEVPSPITNALKLNVRLTVGNKVEGYNGQITLLSSKEQSAKDFSEGKAVKYAVHFPVWVKYPPMVNRIQVNGETVCYGHGLSLDQVPVLTTIDLEHILTIGNPPKRHDGTYPINPNNAPAANINGPTATVQRPPENVFLKGVVEANSQNEGNYFNQRPQNSFNYHMQQYYNYHNNRNPYHYSYTYYNRPSYYYTTSAPPAAHHHLPALLPPPSNRQPSHDPNNFPPYLTKTPFTFPASDFSATASTASLPAPTRIPTIGNRLDFLASYNGYADTKKDTDFLYGGGGEGSSSEPPMAEGCGITEKKIVQLLAHAEPVVDVRYPWLVAIFIKSERSLNFACGGSLISYRHVISAAHCFPDDDPEMYQFVMSDNMRHLFSFENKTVREAFRVFRHPQYLPKSADADIAIAVLRSSVPRDRHISPVCLWSEDIDIRLVVGKFGIVVGWGQDENNHLAKNSPKEVSMPILDAAECIQSNALFSEFVSARSFCAGYKNGTGPCFGDSGNGFIMNRNGRYTLRGIVSITILDNVFECKISDYSALTDVTKFSHWIKGILNAS